MSCQKGNGSRQRPQKYQNKTSFKNTLHDTSQRTKIINNIVVQNVCNHCKGVIEWKIKYKKYKPLSQMKTCVRCSQKCIKQAYHVICSDCAKKSGVCAKCLKSSDIINETANDLYEELNEEMKMMLKKLPERKRRTFLRYMNKKNDESNEDGNIDLMEKLKSLSVDQDDDEDEDDYLSD